MLCSQWAKLFRGAFSKVQMNVSVSHVCMKKVSFQVCGTSRSLRIVQSMEKNCEQSAHLAMSQLSSIEGDYSPACRGVGIEEVERNVLIQFLD
ncbi:hypothetical protein TH19_19005 [Thalassospira profundimaris]|uniref:Uncharacterized protein n=1 Tax=Thalassospira profundimaris TaxID=502049 RepID=A0A367W0D6_9PROT|nr:hypothetical protein TH19_19005 [Thalassospira profundimaris]